MDTAKPHLITGKRNAAYREAARRRYPDVSVADGAAVFPLADGGAWVECLVRVFEESAILIEKEEK